ncbi:MAG TPA: oligosaccharide flippase family protein [Vicinamibacterales bacterium]|nr:oligosaccharide flippase family protein [Vicinamibacterales bacterium]
MGRSYLIVIACQAVAAAATLAGLRWLATYVDPETFGRYSLYQSVVAAAALFLVSWPNAALLRFGREEWTQHGRVGATLGARAALYTVCAAVAIALAWMFDPWIRAFLDVEGSPFVWVATGVVVIPATELAIYANQAIGRTEVYGYSPAITRLGFLLGLALIPLAVDQANWTYLAGWLLGSTAAAGVFALVTMPLATWSGFGVRVRTVTTLLKYSWALPFGAISTYVVNWIDSWVIRDVRGVGAVGVYNWAYQTTAIASLAFAPIAVILTPRVIDARLKDDRAKIKRYVDSILTSAIALAAGVLIALVLVFPGLHWMAASSYAAAYSVILILLSALPFQLIAYLVTPLANAYERLLPRIVVVSVAIATINTVGDLVLVPRLGINGAAIATLTAFLVGSLLLVVVIRSAGIEFAPVWRYAIPAFILLPGVAALHWAGPRVGALVIGGLAAGSVLALGIRRLRASRTRAVIGTGSAFSAWWNALTLSDLPNC